MYIMDAGSKKIYSYNVTSDSWSQLPDCVYKYCLLAIIDGLLTTIGGYLSPLYANELFSLTGEGNDRRWTQQFPSMPTERMSTAAVCSGSMLIVVGGIGRGGQVLLTVEIMNTEHHQWSTAASLPEPLYYTSLAVCGEQIFMLGGRDKHFSDTTSVYTCSVSALLQSCVWSSLEATFKRASLVDESSTGSVWGQITDLPVKESTCESFHGQLLAILVGGWTHWEPPRLSTCTIHPPTPGK